MTKAAPALAEGFDIANIPRIYHGEPALIGGKTPAELLGGRQFKAIACVADGLTRVEVAEILERPTGEVEDDIRSARDRLGILDTFQLAGYFPLDQEHGAIGEKKLADPEEVPGALDILEAISVGKRNKQVAARAGMSTRTLRERLSDIEEVWEDVEGGLMLARVASAVRARYVNAIESKPGTIGAKHVPLLTLPRLAKLEPRIHSQFPGTSPEES
jgi:DNA-binding CsgD family transcriptional regulator